jgi:hypothetical protein
MAFILGKTVPSMPNKVCRFIFLFVLCVPFSFVVDWVHVWAFGYHKIGWTGALISALLPATYGTFLPPQSHNSNKL